MSKNRNRKWYDKFENENYDNYDDNRKKDRRQQKRIKSAIKTRNIDYLESHDEDY